MPNRRGRRPAVLATAALLAACQPLPHPFADDRPPAALLRVRDVTSVSVAPIVGTPTATAARLGGAVAAALLKHEIPASDRTTSLGSELLYGRVVESRPQHGQTRVTALWRLYDARGRVLGERRAELEGGAHDWESGSNEAVDKLAALSAERLLPLLQDEAPVEPPRRQPNPSDSSVSFKFHEEGPVESPGGGRTRVAIRHIGGAPGDGATSLAAAVATVLKRRDLAIVGSGDKADLFVDCQVTVAPAQSGKQHVKIVWHVSRADGAEIGTVGQENDVPKGLLDGAWGDNAYNVALMAGDGLMRLVARGMPPPKS